MKSLFILLCVISFSYAADDGTCKKCQVLRKYHEENPCPYEYYEDYIKALEEKKEVPKKINPEELLKEEEEKKTTVSE